MEFEDSSVVLKTLIINISKKKVEAYCLKYPVYAFTNQYLLWYALQCPFILKSAPQWAQVHSPSAVCLGFHSMTSQWWQIGQ
jgi:hypothetical protein